MTHSRWCPTRAAPRRTWWIRSVDRRPAPGRSADSSLLSQELTHQADRDSAGAHRRRHPSGGPMTDVADCEDPWPTGLEQQRRAEPGERWAGRHRSGRIRADRAVPPRATISVWLTTDHHEQARTGRPRSAGTGGVAEGPLPPALSGEVLCEAASEGRRVLLIHKSSLPSLGAGGARCRP